MKLRDIAKGKRAVKAVPFRLANAPDPKPVPSGEEATVDDEYTVLVGVRVLTGDERADALAKAQADARSKGVTEWLDTHPLCLLYEMAHVVALATVDNAKRDEPFFASAAEVLSSPDVGEDNIAYLYEQQRAWQDQCSLRSGRDIGPVEAMALLAQEAERPENAPSPFGHMRAASLPSFFRTTAFLFQNLLTLSSLSTGSGESSGISSLPTSESEPKTETRTPADES